MLEALSAGNFPPLFGEGRPKALERTVGNFLIEKNKVGRRGSDKGVGVGKVQ